jgi:uncharacterized membrane protein YdbT with pleckstrin-like domain
MGYVDNNLAPGERILLRATPHWGLFIGPILVTVIGGLLVLLFFLPSLTAPSDQDMIASSALLFLCCIVPYLLFSALVLGSAAARYFTTEFAVTDRRIIAKTGLLRQRSLELVLNKVESIGVDQPIFGRMLNFGTIVVSGSGGTRQRFPSIADPMRLRSQINQILPRSG